jgi:hypothetical protein
MLTLHQRGRFRRPGGENSVTLKKFLVSMFVLGMFGLLASPGALAATVTTVDCGSDSSALANAVAAAGSGDTIQFTGSCVGNLYMNGANLTIEGVAPGATTSGGGSDHAVFVANSTVVLRDMTITGGVSDTGGGIFSYISSNLTLDRVLVTGNTANGGNQPDYVIADGGGIFAYSNGSLTIVNSTISGNTATASGGSTLNAAEGGGIFTYSGTTVSIVNSTITGNTAIASGASSISNGGGIGGPSGNSVTFTGSILQDNTASSGPDCDRSITSGGYNLFGSTSGCTVTTQSTDKVGVDPMLAPLADNGGMSETELPQAGSPVINAIPKASCPSADGGVDQRGSVRPSAGRCDIGAVEVYYQPDAAIRKKPGRTFVGFGVFNTTGAGQTIAVKTARGTTQSFNINVGNQGDVPRTLGVLGCSSDARGFSVQYTWGAKNVTFGVVHGLFRVKDLSPGAHTTVTLAISVRSTTPVGATKTCKVVEYDSQYKAVKDAVVAKVTAT